LGDEDKLSENYGIKARDISNSTIVFANTIQIITDSKELVEGGMFGIGKSRCLPIQASLVNEKPSHKEIIKGLKPYLDQKDHQALILAYARIKLEDMDCGEGNQTVLEAGIEIKKKLEERFEERGKHIYNDCRSNFMEDIIFPLIQLIEADIEDPIQRVTKCKEKINEFLDYNPVNIYVNEYMNNVRVYHEINRRLLIKKELLVRVYGRGKHWERVIEVSTEFRDNNPEIKLHKQDNPLGDSPAGCCRLWNSEEGDRFIEVEEKWRKQIGLGDD